VRPLVLALLVFLVAGALAYYVFWRIRQEHIAAYAESRIIGHWRNRVRALEAAAALVLASDETGESPRSPRDFTRRFIKRFMKRNRGVRYIYLRDQDNRIVLHNDAAREGRIVSSPSPFDPSAEKTVRLGEALWTGPSGESVKIYHFSYPIVVGRELLGTLCLGVDRDEVKLQAAKRLRVFASTLIPAAAIGLAILVAAGGTVIYLEHQYHKLLERNIEREQLVNLGFVARGLAHEIRNPLNSIMMNVELLEEAMKEKDGYGDEIAETAADTYAEIRKLRDLLQRFLVYAKPQSAVRELVDLNEVAEVGARSLGPEFKARDIEIDLNLSGDPVKVLGDPDDLHRVYLNLLRNAMEAMSNGRGWITVHTARADDKCELTVSDGGQGIAIEDMDRLFEPFFTLKKHGSGLGLAIVKRIVNNHRGTVTIKSEQNVGTEVTVTLPAAGGDES